MRVEDVFNTGALREMLNNLPRGKISYTEYYDKFLLCVSELLEYSLKTLQRNPDNVKIFITTYIPVVGNVGVWFEEDIGKLTIDKWIDTIEEYPPSFLEIIIQDPIKDNFINDVYECFESDKIYKNPLLAKTYGNVWIDIKLEEEGHIFLQFRDEGIEAVITSWFIVLKDVEKIVKIKFQGNMHSEQYYSNELVNFICGERPFSRLVKIFIENWKNTLKELENQKMMG
jgi:hypothetical protein